MLSLAAKKGSSSSRSQETTFKVESSIPALQNFCRVCSIKSFLGEHTSTPPPPFEMSCFALALNILPLKTLQQHAYKIKTNKYNVSATT